jgi:uncharacterized protein
LSVAPVKGLRLACVDAVELETTGVRGDRRFYLVDEAGALTNAKRAPLLLTVRPEVHDGRILLRFPDGAVVEGEIALADSLETSFYGRPVTGRVVEGPWNEALSELARKRLRLVKADREGDAQDRGPVAGATLVSTASLEALGAAAGVIEPVDGRRFRMNVGVTGVEAHAEDGWIDGRVRIGGAVVVVRGKVGRCAVTTLDPDRGVRDLETLDAIAAYRGDVPTREPLPFGVWCEVVEPGPVTLGDSVEPLSG